MQVVLKPKGEFCLYGQIQAFKEKNKRIQVSDFISSFEKEVHTNLSDLVKEVVDDYRE